MLLRYVPLDEYFDAKSKFSAWVTTLFELVDIPVFLLLKDYYNYGINYNLHFLLCFDVQ